jgi:hypothetical protein
MNRKNVVRVSALVVGICASLIGASAQAAGYYYRNTTSTVFLSDSGGVETQVLSVNVPAGTWVVTTQANLVNFGAVDIARCRIWVNGSPLSFSSTMLGGGNNFPAVASVTNTAVISLPAKQAIALKCGHDANVPGQRIDSGAQLVITRAPAS